jgi:lipopolysaccharide transport system permease protein
VTSAHSLLHDRRIVHGRDLLRVLIRQDIKIRYTRSVLGMAWSLFNPLLQLMVFYFIFQSVLAVNVPRYFCFLFTGLLAWNWFQSSLVVSAGAIVNNAELIKQPGFPVALLPVVTVASQLVNFLLALPILLLLLVLEGPSLTLTVLVLPVPVAAQFLLMLGLAYLAATFHVALRDTQYIVAVLLQLLLFLTPVFYEASRVPAPYDTLYRLNPMVHLLEAYRAILVFGQLPDGSSLLGVGLLSGVLLAVGSLAFSRASHTFVDEL